MPIAFAEFLLRQERISSETAQNVSDWVSEARLPIGMIAVAHGLLSYQQIDELLKRERSPDTRFGDVVVEMGFLTRDQVETLLAIQRFRQSMDLAERLAVAGVLPLRQAASALGEFLQTKPLDAAPRRPEQTTSDRSV